MMMVENIPFMHSLANIVTAEQVGLNWLALPALATKRGLTPFIASARSPLLLVGHGD